MMRFLLSIAMVVMMAAGAVSEDHVTLNESGNSAFEKGNFEEALDFYRQAEMARPETPEIYYNEANAMIETGKFETAVEKLEKALNSDNILLQADAYYNGGSGFFKQEDYKQAIEWYQKSLELNPDDLDTKYNLELARNRLKEQMEKQPQDQQQQDEQDKQQQEQEQEQQQEDQQEEKSQDQQDQEQQQQQQEQQSGEDEEQKEQEQQQMQQNPEEMSKEDALRILNALKDTEEDNQKKQKRFKVKGNYRGNDW